MPASKKQYDVIILAGHTPKADALAAETGEDYKALLRIHGRPMIRFVLDALYASGRVRRFVLVGLSHEALAEPDVHLPLTFVPDHQDIIDNSLAALEVVGDAEYVLFCSTDIPLLTPQAAGDFLERCEAAGADLCYPIISREVMEARFPGSGRSFRELVDGHYCGGDMYLVRPEVVRRHADFGRALAGNRKSAWGLAKALGPEIVVRFLLGRLHISDLEKRVNRILGCTCKAIISPYAELGMDVDKPHHLRVVLRAMDEAGT